MGSYCGENGAARPTFLPLSLKRNQFYPTLPRTPEHGAPYDTMIGITDGVVTNWELLSSSRYDVAKKFYDDESRSEVFPPDDEEKSYDEKTVTQPPCSGDVMKTKGLKWNSAEEEVDSPCCSQWLRAYISKLWMKTPPEPPPSPAAPESPPKLKQLTILERELTFKQISPKRLRRISKKRHGATSQFVYSAYVEDIVCELREERHKDVIYSITIRRDGSLTRNGSISKSLTNDIMKDQSTSKHLKGATLDFMVERLSKVFVGENEDANFLNVFLTTYRTFATPEELFTKLRDEYLRLKEESANKNMPKLKSIVRVFRAWLERYLFDDFQDFGNQELLRNLHEFAKIHDDVMNYNDVTYTEKKTVERTPSPIPKRKNGVCGAVFAHYVAAKLAVVTKAAKDSSESSPQQSPTHSQDPTLNVLSEGSTVNMSASKTLLSFSSRYIATQLTVIAAKLFHRVQPHHCLAAAASSKNRPQTVQATIDQFNRVVYCVVGTILCLSLTPSHRTKLMRKWIEVAQECRELKNFSSLRAIVSGLQTYALHRLQKSWMGVPQSHTNLLKELAEMNMKDLLLKVGTAKVNTEDSAITRVRKEANIRRVQDMHSGIMHGTVPYLGSFLTDLTFLDTARPNFLEGGLINFEKHRKEFELLAQLQLWQASCRSYQNLEPDEDFMKWFQSITVLTEEQTFQLSEMIEPPIPASPAQVTSPAKKSLVDMIHSEYERSTMTPSQSWQKSRKAENGSCGKDNKLSQSFSGRINTSSPSGSDKNRMVKVRLVRNKAKTPEVEVADGEQDTDAAEAPIAICEYKTISISSDERRGAVVKRALEAFMLDAESNSKRFSLVQLLHDKEIQIPDNANVFYAMNFSDQEAMLLLLEEGAEIPHKVKRHQSTPNRPKKTRHRKNHSLSSVLEPETPRSSPLSNVSSPMKNLYRQIAIGSVTLVGGASYSPSIPPRRPSEDAEIAGNDGIVLTNSRSGMDLQELGESGDKIGEITKRSSLHLSRSTERLARSSRCHSADFANGVVLPVRVVQPSRASISGINSQQPKSAPASPKGGRRKESANSVESVFTPDMPGVITATGRLVEWPRYSRSASNNQPGRSATWSSRRALRKPKKHGSFSTFYVSSKHSTSSGDQAPKPESSSASRSKFYVDMDESLHVVKPTRPTTLGRRSHSSNTLPPRLVPDFSGHDYDGTSESTSADDNKSARSWEDAPVRRSSSYTSVSSNPSEDANQSGNSGSGITFSALSNEDNVFHEGEQRAGAPQIKIQCASPNNLLNESGFFERYGTTHSESDSQDDGHENEEDEYTCL